MLLSGYDHFVPTQTQQGGITAWSKLDQSEYALASISCPFLIIYRSVVPRASILQNRWGQTWQSQSSKWICSTDGRIG